MLLTVYTKTISLRIFFKNNDLVLKNLYVVSRGVGIMFMFGNEKKLKI